MELEDCTFEQIAPPPWRGVIEDQAAEIARLNAALVEARDMLLQSCAPVAATPDIADVVSAVEEWVNKRGGDETVDQIAVMAIQAYQRAALRALAGQPPV